MVNMTSIFIELVHIIVNGLYRQFRGFNITTFSKNWLDTWKIDVEINRRESKSLNFTSNVRTTNTTQYTTASNEFWNTTQTINSITSICVFFFYTNMNYKRLLQPGETLIKRNLNTFYVYKREENTNLIKFLNI